MLDASEPAHTTEPELQHVLEELKRREPIFHRPELGTTRADLERMTAPEFWEVGASGRRYSREFIFEVVEKRYAANEPDVWDASDFYCQRLASDTFLFTYTLVQNATRKNRRSTIWRRTAEGWQILFHQGTVVAE